MNGSTGSKEMLSIDAENVLSMPQSVWEDRQKSEAANKYILVVW